MATGKIISTVPSFEENDDASAMNIPQMKARLGELFQKQIETANEVESLTHRIFAAMEMQQNTAVDQQQNIDQNFNPLNPLFLASDEELGLTVTMDEAKQHHKENNHGEEKPQTVGNEEEQNQKEETKIENIVFEEGGKAAEVMGSPESPSSPSEEEQQQDGEEEKMKHIPLEPLDLNETIPMGEQEEFLSLTLPNNNKQSPDSFESLSSFVPPAMNVTDEKKSGMDDDDAAATPSKQESVMNNTGLEPVNPDEDRAISKNSNGSTFAVQTESEPELKAARPEMQLALASPLLSESGGSLTSNGTSEPVAIDPNAATNTIKVSFSLRRLFAEKTLRSAHKEMAGYRWSMSIQFVKDSLKEGADEEGGSKRVPLSLGLFLHCMGPIEPGLPAGTVHVKQPWFYIHNWAGKMGMKKRAPMSMHFKPPYMAPRGVWFNLEAKQELIERGLITADQLNIKVSVEVEFQTPSEASIGGSPVKQEG